MYLSKLEKYICLDMKIYLFELQNVFVMTLQDFCAKPPGSVCTPLLVKSWRLSGSFEGL